MILRRLATMGLIVTAALGLGGCKWFIGERVEVPPASVGLVLTPNGFEGEIIPPSRFRLDPCFFVCDKLAVIEASDQARMEQMQILMPDDNLQLGVDIRFTMALSDDPNRILEVFDRIRPQRLESGNFGTTLQQVYETYGVSIVRSTARAVITQYSIAEVAANQAAVGAEVRRAIASEFENTPLELRQLGLAGIQFPQIVTQAMEQRREREIAIETAEAEAQIQIRQAQARLEVARANREADLLEAETIAQANQILAEGVTPELIEYRRLNVIQSLGENGNTVFFPLDLVGTEALNLRVLNTE